MPLFLRIAALLTALAAGMQAACAQTREPGTASYPNRPIRFIVPFAAGGGTDFVTRMFAQKLAESWGQQVVVDNRPGAAGIIGSEIVARASPDGHTLLMGTGSHNINPGLYRKLPYDTQRDFAPVVLLATAPTVMSANPAVPAKDARELVALAKANPAKYSYASFGIGSTSHLAGELLRASAGIDLLHIPYKGAGDAMSNLLGGQVSTMFSSPASVLPQFKAGRLRGLAITGAKRAPSAPELPTFAELGMPSVEVTEWYGVLVPAGTPRAVVVKLRDELVRILRLPDITERLATAQAAEVVGGTPEDLGRFIAEETAKWTKLVRQAGIRLE